MLKKIEKTYLFLEENIRFLTCPLCQSSFTVEKYALTCENRHNFAINKKGYVNFLQTKADTEHYTRKMFEPRRRMIQAGMYSGLLEKMSPYLVNGQLLDIGTGEGSFLQLLDFDGSKFAFDIAKEGIEMATELEFDKFLSLADLTKLPFASQSISSLLNILTPSNYSEFDRVMTEDGVLVKVIPDQYYLAELREIYGLPVDYDNQNVVERFRKEYPDFIEEEVHYKFEIPEDLRSDFLQMSPLEWSISPEIKEKANQNPPQTATIHMKILIGKKS